MCAQPAPASSPPRSRNSPLQWIGLAVLVLLLLDQMGLLRISSPDSLLGSLVDSIPFLVAIVLAVTVHEFSHALVATLFGDDLPRRAGRLTLNPLAHLDLLGSLLFLIARFGWGKPVPINPNAMRYPGLGWALSSVAGPVSNLLASAAAVVLVAALGSPREPLLGELVQQFIGINVVLAVFNLIPLPPLDGFGFVYGLSPRPLQLVLQPIQVYGPWILLGLVFLPRLVPGFPPVLGTIVEAGMGFFLSLLETLYRAI